MSVSHLIESDNLGGLPDRLTLRGELLFHVRESSDPHVILEDPLRGKFYRLGIAEYRFLVLLNDAGTVQQAWQRFQETSQTAHETDRPAFLSTGQAVGLCRWVLANGLAAKAKPSATISTRRTGSWRLLNPFFIKWSLLNPDRFLSRLEPHSRPLFTWQFVAATLVLALAAVTCLLGRLDEFVASYENIVTAGRSTRLLIIWCLLKVVHEIGHGAVCKKYGGEVHDAGVAFLLFAPVAYIDVTSSWRFASRWRRLHVTLAGVIVEMVIACVAILWWHYSAVPWMRQCAADIALLASVSTLLFNLNPLMRFDGYFLLCDLLDIDNLYQNGSTFARYWAQRHLLGLPVTCPPLPSRRTTIVKAYGLAAALWRATVVVSLIAAAAALFHGAGLLIAAFGVVMWIIVPTAQFGRYLFDGIATKQFRAAPVLMRLGLGCGLTFALLVLTPAQPFRSAPAIVEFRTPAIIRPTSAGFVERVHVQAGQQVERGTLLVTLSNPELEIEFSAVQRALADAKLQARSGQWRRDAARFRSAMSQVEALEKQHAELERKLAGLSIYAPIDGTVIARRLPELEGTYLHPGNVIAEIGNEDSKRITLSIDQSDIEDLAGNAVNPVRAWVPGVGTWKTSISHIDPRADRLPPHESLCATAGGELAVERSASGSLLLCQPRFNAHIDLDHHIARRLYCGQRCVVYLGASPRSVGQLLLNMLVDVWGPET